MRTNLLRLLSSGTLIKLLLAGALPSCVSDPSRAAETERPVAPAAWNRVPEILKRIQPPKFPARDFKITSFGAKGDGTSDCTAAFKKAIERCNKAGGGRV